MRYGSLYAELHLCWYVQKNYEILKISKIPNILRLYEILWSYNIQLYEHNESQKNTILKAKELCREDEMFTGI